MVHHLLNNRYSKSSNLSRYWQFSNNKPVWPICSLRCHGINSPRNNLSMDIMIQPPLREDRLLQCRHLRLRKNLGFCSMVSYIWLYSFILLFFLIIRLSESTVWLFCYHWRRVRLPSRRYYSCYGYPWWRLVERWIAWWKSQTKRTECIPQQFCMPILVHDLSVVNALFCFAISTTYAYGTHVILQTFIFIICQSVLRLYRLFYFYFKFFLPNCENR